MDECVAEAIGNGRKMLAIISQVSTLDRPHKVRHHFLAPPDVCDPPELPDGSLDLRDPAATYEYCRILVDHLDPARFEVDAMGWHLGLEAIEEADLSEAWVTSTAEEMCGLASLSGTIYAGWDWMSFPESWPGLPRADAADRGA
jgi:hypothetical protein